jgi:hypothetical protein
MIFHPWATISTRLENAGFKLRHAQSTRRLNMAAHSCAAVNADSMSVPLAFNHQSHRWRQAQAAASP